jgi:hypothetical protein
MPSRFEKLTIEPKRVQALPAAFYKACAELACLEVNASSTRLTCESIRGPDTKEAAIGSAHRCREWASLRSGRNHDSESSEVHKLFFRAGCFCSRIRCWAANLYKSCCPHKLWGDVPKSPRSISSIGPMAGAHCGVA